jgi:mannopine transport system permease protein
MTTSDLALRAPGRRPLSRATIPAGQYSPLLSLALISPLLALLGLAFIYPVGQLLVRSFFIPHFQFSEYLRIFDEPLYLRVLWRTLRLASIVTALCLVLGYPVAHAMARAQRRWSTIAMACVLVPLWTSVLVRSYAWIILLQRNGIINTTLMDTGIVSEPLRLIYTEGAVVVAMTHVLLPFMILPIFASLRSIPNELTQAAHNLGASSWTAFRRVTLPLSLPGVFAGSLMTFIVALGFYITPALVGGPSTLLMATLIGQQMTVLLDWPFAGALSAFLLITTLALAVMARKVFASNRGFDNAE